MAGAIEKNVKQSVISMLVAAIMTFSVPYVYRILIVCIGIQMQYDILKFTCILSSKRDIGCGLDFKIKK